MTNPTSSALPIADIHLQLAPGIWPLAWGWWLVIFLTLAILIFAFTLLYLRAKKNQAKKDALRQLNGPSSLAEINALLKRAALSYFRRDQVAGLTGNRWLAFLDSQLPENKQGFIANESLWLKGAFSNVPLTDQELNSCKSLATIWLNNALPPRQQYAIKEEGDV